jgi:dTDP-4-amino-4,6-dideoxygalactose transaminase
MILKDQTDKTKFTNKIFFTSAARIACRHLLNNLKIDKDTHILLPSYIGHSLREGSGVLDPIEECGLKYSFYKVNRDLSADLEDLEDKLTLFKTFAIFVIHYFGFVQSNMKAIKKMCQNNKIYLIEDCAHCLRSIHTKIPVGNYGDFSLFSIHKVLPTINGGILKVNRDDIHIPPVTETDKITFESLEIYAGSDFRRISNIRISNYIYLNSLLSHFDKIDIFYPKLKYKIVPLNFPILLKENDRYDIYKKLLDNNIQTTALYYELVDSINKESYPTSFDISRNILNLPIHQDLQEKDLETIALTLKKVLV